MDNQNLDQLAALALLSTLYNNKKDLVEMLAEFIVSTVAVNGNNQFTPQDIKQALHKEYGFTIPVYVVETAIKRKSELFRKENKSYRVVNRDLLADKAQIPGERNKYRVKQEILVQRIFRYIEAEREVSLTEIDKSTITSEICSLVVWSSESNNGGTEFTKLINCFILENQEDNELKKTLNEIKEGAIIHIGLQVSKNINELRRWNKPLCCYLDTEILVNYAGLNGSIFQEIAQEFFDLVNEINVIHQKKFGQAAIRLRYFQEVEKELNGLYYNAENIFQGLSKQDPSKTAIRNILDGCSTLSDIQLKMAELFVFLKKNHILVDDRKAYISLENAKFNLVSEPGYDLLAANDITDKDTLSFLTYINVLREGSNPENLEDAEYVLITGTSDTIRAARHPYILSESDKKQTPLAIDINYPTMILWFKLRKGLHNGRIPKSMDVIMNARIAISSSIVKGVKQEYEALLAKREKGEISEEAADLLIAKLSTSRAQPEDIDADFTQYYKSTELSDRFENKIDFLASRLKASEKETENYKKDSIALKETRKENLRLKEQQEKDAQIISQMQRNEALRRRRNRRTLLIVGLVGVLAVGVIFLLVFHIDAWGLFTAIGIVLSILLFFGIDAKAIKKGYQSDLKDESIIDV